VSGQRRPGQGGAGAPPAAADGGPRPWAQLVQERTLLAMLLEASVPKPGNVGPGLSRPGTHYHHYLASAAALGPSLRAATEGTVPLGQTVLQAVRDSQASQPGGNVQEDDAHHHRGAQYAVRRILDGHEDVACHRP